MALKVHCDGPDCTHVLDYDDTHITVTLENASTETADDFDISEHQFCSMPCLSAWGFALAMNDDHVT